MRELVTGVRSEIISLARHLDPEVLKKHELSALLDDIIRAAKWAKKELRTAEAKK